jgi:hypothetical protein
LAQRPAQSAERPDVVLLLFGQDVAHARVGTRSSSLASTSRSVSRGGRFSGVHQWPVLGVHRGS